MLEDVNLDRIKKNEKLTSLFVNANFDNLSINCNILESNFFSDSYHYFPIADNNKTFSPLFFRVNSPQVCVL